jgi:hypothetical protein
MPALCWKCCEVDYAAMGSKGLSIANKSAIVRASNCKGPLVGGKINFFFWKIYHLLLKEFALFLFRIV